MVNETTKRLIARVKQLRQAQGHTQEQFAERADLDPKYYQHFEAGRKLNPEMDTLLKLAKGCGMELWQLFNFEITPAVAEDPDKRGYHSLPGKGGRKPRKPKSGKQ